ncbi:AI-2E family transporter [Hydrogenimonas urashimensis]|uniref:AI-2E family transporter n=1 Tax=Hydrogenimonas urashimensis TaxID=2740515 RepID=UPI001915CBA0|nr:AI-2E family transporter [Hydrogenimonas urashimensis]
MKPQYFITLLLLVSGYFLYRVFMPFMQDIAIAILLMFATLGIARHIGRRVEKRWVISTVMSLLLGIMFFAPLVYMINAIAVMVTHIDPIAIHELVVKTANYLQSISLPPELLERFNIDTASIHKVLANVFSEESIRKYLKHAISFLGTMAAQSAVFFKDMVLILIFYFFAYYYGEKVGPFIKRILPLDTAQTQLLFNELSNSMGVVFFSILATAILEGTLFAIVVLFFGLDAILLGILYGFASLVPVIGGALMWVPTSIYLWVTQGATPALVVVIYSIVVISIIADTFVKPVIIKEIDQKMLKENNTRNEMLVFFSIIAGLTTYGFWGMIIGPAITTVFIAILKLYVQFQTGSQTPLKEFK